MNDTEEIDDRGHGTGRGGKKEKGEEVISLLRYMIKLTYLSNQTKLITY